MGECLDDAQALAFASGELAPELRLSIEDHVDDCDSCRRVLADLVRQVAPTAAAGASADSASASAAWEPGRRVGRYVVRERIGRGGMGAVFRADDVELGRAVALKRLHADADARERLIREARSVAQLQHPNVVTVHEIGEDSGAWFLAMELVDGVTLTEWLREQPRGWREAVAVLAQAGRGLAAAHARGLIHRDFKPDNVLIDRIIGGELPRARVVDFGLARPADSDPGEPGGPHLPSARQISTGVLAGTPAYLAPEVVAGAPADERSDQYAFAVSLFEAIHGQHPFEGTSTLAMWDEMSRGRVRAGRDGIPPWLDRAIRRGLAVAPAQRWPSVADLVAEIAPRRSRAWPIMTFAGVGIGALGLIFALSRAHVAAPLDDCARGTALVETLWNPELRAAQAQRFLAIAPLRATTIATTAALVDDWTAAWRLGRTAACTAAPERRTAVLDCLGRELGELRAQLAVWTVGDRATLDHAVGAASALPRPDDCTAHAPPARPATPELDAAVAKVHALYNSGKEREASEHLDAMVAAAEATADPWMIENALTIAATVGRHVGGAFRERGRDQVARAAREAARAGDDQGMVLALTLEAQLATDLDHPGDALGLCDAAVAIVVRNKLDNEPNVDIIRAHALAKLGRAPEAVAAVQHAIALLEPRAERDRSTRLSLAAALGTLGNLQGQQAKYEDARQSLLRTLAIERAELGENDPAVGRALHDLANRELNLELLDDATAHYLRARDIFAAAYGIHHEAVGSTDVALGNLELSRHHYDQARTILLRARDELTGAVPPTHAAFALIEEVLGSLEHDTGHGADALAHYARAVELSVAAGAAGENLATQRTNYGLELTDAGHYADARVQLEAAIAEYDRLGSAQVAYVDAWLGLADVEAHDGHKAAAVALLRKYVAVIGEDPRPGSGDELKTAQDKIRRWSR